MKYCPICGQQIQEAAVRCRYCKNWLVPSGAASEANSGVPPYPSTTTSGLAIASMILGILWVYWIGSIVALVLGYLALREIRQEPHRVQGKGMATAGIILGWVGVATLFLAILMGIYLWEGERENPANSKRDTSASLFEKRPQLISGGSSGQCCEQPFTSGLRSFLGRNGPKRGVGQ
jgi:hypothetical protein